MPPCRRIIEPFWLKKTLEITKPTRSPRCPCPCPESPISVCPALQLVQIHTVGAHARDDQTPFLLGVLSEHFSLQAMPIQTFDCLTVLPATCVDLKTHSVANFAFIQRLPEDFALFPSPQACAGAVGVLCMSYLSQGIWGPGRMDRLLGHQVDAHDELHRHVRSAARRFRQQRNTHSAPSAESGTALDIHFTNKCGGVGVR